MKIWLFFVLIVFAFVSQADEVSPWANVYEQVKKAYVYDVQYDDLAVAALKGLKKIDKDLTLGDDDKRLTLYYKGKVVKVEKKPQDDEPKDWGLITDNMIAKACEISAKTERKSFEINSLLAKEMVKILDKDSKFYGDLDEANGIKIKNERQFAARMEDDILYIKIGAFNKQTKNEMLEALSEYAAAKALILDLRGSGGGMLGEAIEVADLFLNEGIIASTKGKNRAEEVYYLADKNELFAGKPMVILVDGNTASAAEVLAVALQEQTRAKIVGTGTKGKGSIQKLINIYPDNGVLAVTNAFFVTPSGAEFNQKGIIPDVCTFGEVKYMSDDKKCPAEGHETSEIELIEAKKMLNLLK